MSKREAESVRLAKDLELRTRISLLREFGADAAPTFNAFAAKYLPWYGTEFPDSYALADHRIRKHILPHLGAYQLDSIPKYELAKWRQQLLDGRLPSTANGVLSTFNAMLSRAVEWGALRSHPYPDLKMIPDTRDEVPKFLSKEDLHALYAGARTALEHWVPVDNDRVDYATIWQLMVNTGLRRTEMLNLRWEDVHSTHLLLQSRTGARTKSSKMRRIPLNDAARSALAMLKMKAAGRDTVIPRVQPNTLSKRFAVHRDIAGLPDNLTLHSLRHTFASHLVMAGVPLRTVQKYLGHSSIAMTEIYASLAPDHLQESVEKIAL